MSNELDMARFKMVITEGWDESGERFVTFNFDSPVDGLCVPLYDGLAMLELAKLNLLARYRKPGHDEENE